MTRDLESMLEYLGLDADEAAVYKLLVSKGSGTVGKLSAMTCYSRTKIYAIVDKLSSKGWVLSISDKPKTYAPIDPKQVIEMKKRSLTSSSDGLLAELTPLYQESMTNLNQTITYRGDKVLKKVEEMIEHAQNDISIAASFLPQEAWDEITPLLADLKKQGVSIHLFVSEQLKDQKLISSLEDEMEVIIGNIPDAGMLIVDGKELLLGSKKIGENDNIADLLGIWTRSEELAHFMQVALGGMRSSK